MKPGEIKIYKDTYADNDVLCAFKGKTNYEPGVIFCSYKKPNIWRRIINKIKYKIKSIFGKTSQAVEITKLNNKN